MILEGRDGAGKDGAIKRLTEHMSPRDTRVHAPGKPSDREETQWYFQRFVPFLPSGRRVRDLQPLLVQPRRRRAVMGFCTKDRGRRIPANPSCRSKRCWCATASMCANTISTSPRKSRRSGLRRARRSAQAVEDLADRRGGAEEMERLFQGARQDVEAHQPCCAPWTIVRSDVKKIARLELLRDLLASFLSLCG